MSFKLLVLLIFCVILRISSTDDSLAHCRFSENNFEIDDVGVNEKLYTCSLVTYDELGSPVEINTYHEGQYIDSDVKLFTLDHDNVLKKLSPIVCNKFRNLDAFWIEDAQIEVVNKHTFENCEELKYLQLAANKFSELGEHLLHRNSKLEVIKITENYVKHLHEHFFLNQLDLKHLDLHGNEFHSLPNKIFHSLTKLENLILWGNKIHALKPEWFTTLHNLKTLDVDQNKISTLNTGIFRPLVNLEILSLARNEITELPRDVFSSLINVRNISMFHNYLTILHSDTFGALKNLTWLDVKRNDINAVDQKLIDDHEFTNFNMRKNLCGSFKAHNHDVIKRKLKLCFDHYQTRSLVD